MVLSELTKGLFGDNLNNDTTLLSIHECCDVVND